MTDEEDEVQGVEGQGLDDEEIGGPDRLSTGLARKVCQLWLGGRHGQSHLLVLSAWVPRLSRTTRLPGFLVVAMDREHSSVIGDEGRIWEEAVALPLLVIGGLFMIVSAIFLWPAEGRRRTSVR